MVQEKARAYVLVELKPYSPLYDGRGHLARVQEDLQQIPWVYSVEQVLGPMKFVVIVEADTKRCITDAEQQIHALGSVARITTCRVTKEELAKESV